MSSIAPCSESDLEEVARLHLRAFPGATASPEALARYYRRTFYEHPWFDPRMLPLIGREKGRIAGFFGVIPRPMRWQGRSITAAVVHRAMVDPELATPFTARTVFRELLSGPQDFTISDACNFDARSVWVSLGGEVVLASSLDWIMPIRPFSSAGLDARRRARLRPVVALLRPALVLGDKVADSVGRSGGSLVAPMELRETPEEEALQAIRDLTLKRPLSSQYTPETWAWILGRLRENETRGRFFLRLAIDNKDRTHGVCAWYEAPDRSMEVVLLVARPSRAEVVYSSLFKFAWQAGLVAATGRVDRVFMSSSLARKCRLEQRQWTVISASDPELRSAYHSGEAMFTGFDHERWLRSPMDRL